MRNGDSYRIRDLPESDAVDLAADLEGDGLTLTLTQDPPRWAWWRPVTIVHLVRSAVSSVELT